MIPLISGGPLQHQPFVPHRILWSTIGQTWLVLGSQDFRKSYGLAYQMVKPDERLSFRQNEAQLVFEANMQSSTGRRPTRADNVQHNWGLLALGRYELGKPGTRHAFWEAGWGLEYVDRTSQDLNLRWNSTPTLGLGYVLPGKDGHDWYFNLRFRHISNGGTRLPNQGQNWLLLMVGYRF